ncbi:hypothetical protein GUITHDRAFT_113762, partial [Guillardia theta CCMP2712]
MLFTRNGRKISAMSHPTVVLPMITKSPSAESPTSKSLSVTSLPRCTSEIGFSKGMSRTGGSRSPGAERERFLSNTDPELRSKSEGVYGDQVEHRKNSWVSSTSKSVPHAEDRGKKHKGSRRKKSTFGHGHDVAGDHSGHGKEVGGSKLAFTNTERKALKEISSLSKFCYFKVNDPRLELKDPEERFKDMLVGESTGWEDRLEESIKHLRQKIKDEKHSLSVLTDAQVNSEISSEDANVSSCAEGDEAIAACKARIAEGDFQAAQKALQRAKREYIRVGIDKRKMIEAIAYEIERRRESESKLKFFEVEFQELLGQSRDLFAAKDLHSSQIKLQQARRVHENISYLSSETAMGMAGKLENMQRQIDEETTRRQRLMEDFTVLLREVDESIERFAMEKARRSLEAASDLSSSSSFIREEERLARYRERIQEVENFRQEVLERAMWAEKNAISSCDNGDFSSARRFVSDAAQSYGSICMEESAAIPEILLSIEEGEQAKLTAELLARAESLAEQAGVLLDDREWEEAARVSQSAAAVYADLSLPVPPGLSELMEKIVEGRRAEQEKRQAEIMRKKYLDEINSLYSEMEEKFEDSRLEELREMFPTAYERIRSEDDDILSRFQGLERRMQQKLLQVEAEEAVRELVMQAEERMKSFELEEAEKSFKEAEGLCAQHGIPMGHELRSLKSRIHELVDLLQRAGAEKLKIRSCLESGDLLDARSALIEARKCSQLAGLQVDEELKGLEEEVVTAERYQKVGKSKLKEAEMNVEAGLLEEAEESLKEAKNAFEQARQDKREMLRELQDKIELGKTDRKNKQKAADEEAARKAAEEEEAARKAADDVGGCRSRRRRYSEEGSRGGGGS